MEKHHSGNHCKSHQDKNNKKKLQNVMKKGNAIDYYLCLW